MDFVINNIKIIIIQDCKILFGKFLLFFSNRKEVVPKVRQRLNYCGKSGEGTHRGTD